MRKHRPKTLEEIGLDTYLDSTKEQHNGFDYSAFKRMYESGVNASNMARSFNVDRRTVAKWVIVYEKGIVNE